MESAACFQCGTPWLGRGKFCGTCGAPIHAAAAPAPSSAETWVGDLGAEGADGRGIPTDRVASTPDIPSAPGGAWWSDVPAAPVEYGEHAAPTVVPGYPGYAGGGDAVSQAPYEPALVQDPRWYAGGYAVGQGADIPASFGRRLGARVIDYLLLWAVTFGLFYAAVLVFAAVIEGGPSASDLTGNLTDFGTAIIWAAVIAWIAVSFLPGFLTFWLGQGGAGSATPGRLALGIRLVRADGIERVGYGRSLGRMFASVLDVVFLLSSLSMLWDRDKRTWHDRIAGTAVVRTGAGLRPSRPGPVWSAFGIAVAVTAVISCGAPVVATVVDGDASSSFIADSDRTYYEETEDAGIGGGSGGVTGSGSSSDALGSDFTTGSDDATASPTPTPTPEPDQPSGSVAEALAMEESDAVDELDRLADEGMQIYRGIDALYDVPQLAVLCPGATSEDVRNASGDYGMFDGENESLSDGMGSGVVLAVYRALADEVSEYPLFLLRKFDVAKNPELDPPRPECNGSVEYLVLVDVLLGDPSAPDTNTANNRANAAAAAWCRDRGSALVSPTADVREGPYRRCLARNVGDSGDSYDANA